MPYRTPRQLRGPVLGVLFAASSAFLLSVFWLFIALAQEAGVPPNAAGMFFHVVPVALIALSLSLEGRWGQVGFALRRRTGLFLSISVIGASLSISAMNGLALSGLGSLGILTCTDILFTVVLGWAVFHERIRPVCLVAVCVMVAGAVVRVGGDQAEAGRGDRATQTVSGAERPGEVPSAAPSDSSRERTVPLARRLHLLGGDLLFVLYAFLLALNAFLIKRLLVSVKWNVILIGNFSMRLIAFSAIALATGQASEGWELVRHSPAAAVFLALAGVVLATQMSSYYHGLNRIPVWAVKIFLMTGPIYYLAFDWMFFGHPPGLNAYLGSGLVIAGAVWILLVDPLFHPKPPRGAARG
jgi:drug/metabolite transporter (DMT)-like permease